jgi:DNA replicative helicase MCM subunit Mcm2 (Cdc46/Mcm family)
MAAREAVILMRGQKNVTEEEINIQIMLKSSANHTPIRNMKATHISRLVKVPGIVISASRIQSKATHMRMVCRNCQLTKDIVIKAGFQNITFPRVSNWNYSKYPCLVTIFSIFFLFFIFCFVLFCFVCLKLLDL